MAIIKAENASIKEELIHDGANILAVNISYPAFSGVPEGVVKKLNDFYTSMSVGYFDFCKKNHAVNTKRASEKSNTAIKCGAVMNWYQPYCNGRVMSVICDISFFDGNRKKTHRLVHNWDLADATPCRASDFFDKSRFARRLYCEEIASKIENGDGNFSYFSDAAKIAVKLFDFDRFYFTPKGIAFYYEKNTLFASDSAYPAFVIPFSEVEGLTKQCQNE